IGAGTGLVSIVLSTLLHHLPDRVQANMIATDLPSAIEVLDKNITDNEHCYSSIRLKSAVLDWDEETLPEEVHDGVDFIIMADVTYNTSSFPSLIKTLSRPHKPPAPPPTVLLAYKERDPDERRLWDMALEIGLHFQEIGRIPGAGGMPVEIYSGTFRESF
ncbi:uncharacterized protein FOMMEDRAFT_74231, partial [Fomitiporia mediterranea MF3/22]|uniref:uncharacterized protein n=1 Tax=Fomitiporia mediterranea (strain MF3/22) TaxID=694068 RepID=UPI000440967D